jgi:predicted Fe-Mo cluster-binding NifX family protein
MKLCISSTRDNLDASVDPRFGRCQYFLFINAETMDFEAVGNPAFVAGGGAGIQAAQLVANRGADVVITGNMGPNAFQALQAAGVKIITGAQGTVRSVIDSFRKGALDYAGAPSVETHHGARR